MKPPRGKGFDAFEIALLCALYLGILWGPGPGVATNGLAPLVLALAVAAFLYAAWISPVWIHRDPAAVRGFGSWRTGLLRTDNLRAALRVYGTVAAAATAAIALGTLAADPAAFGRLDAHSFFLKLGLYVVGAAGQQTFFLAVFVVRLRAILGLGERPAAPAAAREWERRRLRLGLAAGAIFCVLHAPNPPLMAAALSGGAAFAWLYCRTPNFFVVVLCHAWIGTLLHRLAGVCMRTGPFYWKRDGHVMRVLFPPLKHWIGNLW